MDEDSPGHHPTPSWVADAVSSIDEHRTEKWTGCCAACGRPGPCSVAAEAASLLRRYRSVRA
jgi:hypothetical protein